MCERAVKKIFKFFFVPDKFKTKEMNKKLIELILKNLRFLNSIRWDVISMLKNIHLISKKLQKNSSRGKCVKKYLKIII